VTYFNNTDLRTSRRIDVQSSDKVVLSLSCLPILIGLSVGVIGRQCLDKNRWLLLRPIEYRFRQQYFLVKAAVCLFSEWVRSFPRDCCWQLTWKKVLTVKHTLIIKQARMIILRANALFTFLMDSFKFSTVECQSVGKSGCRFRQPSGLVVYFAERLAYWWPQCGTFWLQLSFNGLHGGCGMRVYPLNKQIGGSLWQMNNFIEETVTPPLSRPTRNSGRFLFPWERRREIND